MDAVPDCRLLERHQSHSSKDDCRVFRQVMFLPNFALCAVKIHVRPDQFARSVLRAVSQCF